MKLPKKLDPEDDIEVNTDEEFTDDDRKFLIEIYVKGEKNEIIGNLLARKIADSYNNFEYLNKVENGVLKLESKIDERISQLEKRVNDWSNHTQAGTTAYSIVLRELEVYREIKQLFNKMKNGKV